MLKSDLNLLACPRCFMHLEHLPQSPPNTLPPGFNVGTMLWDGSLRCAGCAAVYPILEGVACLAALDAGWLIPLREMESRISLTLRTLQPRDWEEGRKELLAHQAEMVTTLMDLMFAASLEQIDFSQAPKILDVGAGTCRTTETFIKLGAQAIAVDVDLPQLRYLSFAGVDTLPPESYRHPISGQLMHFKEPDPLDHYLTRVFGDIGRLPFPDASFDVVFCRSVLHHLDGHARTMREMARVLKPGGRMLFCAEPIRSIFEVEDLCYDRCVEREEGMNERVWPLWRFLGPIWKYGRQFLVHTWPQPPSIVLRRRVPFLAAWLARRIGPGARVSDWRLLAMPLVNAAVSIYGTRKNRPLIAAKLPPPTPEEQSDLERYCALFKVEPGRLRESTEDLPRKRLEVNAIRRRLLARFAVPPTELDVGMVAVHQLDRGWFDALEFKGRRGRPMAREAWFTLGLPNPRCLILEVALRDATPAGLKVQANGLDCGQFPLQPGVWTTLTIALPQPLDSIVSFHFAGLGGDCAATSPGGTLPEIALIIGRVKLEA